MLVLLRTVTNPLLTAVIKCAAIAAATLILFVSPIQAAGNAYGSFDESGQYSYHSCSGPGRPSIPARPHPLYDQNRRAQEQADLQAELWRQESYRQGEQRRSSAANPVDPNPYNYPEAVVTPGGKTMLCSRSYGYTYCN